MSDDESSETNSNETPETSEEKITITSRDIKRNEFGEFLCLECPHMCHQQQNMVSHISYKHPQYVYKSRSIKIKKNKRQSGKSSGRGLDTWTEEDVADESKTLFYTTSDLERENGKFKCFICSFTSPQSSCTVCHISHKHPRFVHKPQASRKLPPNSRLGLLTWTREELEQLEDPNKKILYSSDNLEKVDGKFKCLCCELTSPQTVDIARHIDRYHPGFVHRLPSFTSDAHLTKAKIQAKETREKKRRGLLSWTEEELANREQVPILYNTWNLEKVDGKFKCLCCDYLAGQSAFVARHIERNHSGFINENPFHTEQYMIKRNKKRNADEIVEILPVDEKKKRAKGVSIKLENTEEMEEKSQGGVIGIKNDNSEASTSELIFVKQEVPDPKDARKRRKRRKLPLGAQGEDPIWNSEYDLCQNQDAANPETYSEVTDFPTIGFDEALSHMKNVVDIKKEVELDAEEFG